MPWPPRSQLMRVCGSRAHAILSMPRWRPACAVLLRRASPFAYAPGQESLTEKHPIDPSQTGVIALEQAVTQTQGIRRHRAALRSAVWARDMDRSCKGPGPLHVDAAAHAALLALTQGKPGIYNIAEEDGAVSSAKAKRELGFDAAFRMDGGPNGKSPVPGAQRNVKRCAAEPGPMATGSRISDAPFHYASRCVASGTRDCDQSSLMPVSLITLVQESYSFWMNGPVSASLISMVVPPIFS